MVNTFPNRKVTVGETVVFTAEAQEMFESTRNRIFTVTDSRLQNGIYTFSLTPVQDPPALNASHTGIFADDLVCFGG